MQEKNSLRYLRAMLPEMGQEQAKATLFYLFLMQMSEVQARDLRYDWRFWARDNQLPPAGNWRIWMLLAGRGFGKTLAINHWALAQAKAMPMSRGALVAATEADARAVLVEGESGILNIVHPDFYPNYEPSKRRLTFPNGSTAALFSADEPDRLRGPQHHWAVCDELAAWSRPQAFDMLLLGLRLGEDPRCAIATTPRPVRLIKQLLSDPTVALTRGSTYDNWEHLAPAFFSQIVNRYEGTWLGRQELLGELLDANTGALFRQALIDAKRVREAPALRRVVVAIDPAVTAGEESAETGIIVAGVSWDGDAYVLADLSMKASPDGWAQEAAAAYDLWEADRIVAEVNNGGDLVEHTIRTVDANLPYVAVRATRGKRVRAEPIAALYEQGKVHHTELFATLEAQMCGEHEGQDRVDALVWALTALMLGDEREVVMRRGYVRA